MTDVELEPWDAPMIELPDGEAVAVFLRGRGLTQARAEHAARGFSTPMIVTKRGCLVRARVPG